MRTRRGFCATHLITLVLMCMSLDVSAGGNVFPLTDWYLQSSERIDRDGAVLSTADFEAEGWYPARVPTTVLACLIDNEVYPDPYYGTNLKAIPGYQEGRWLSMPEDSPFRATWWYRTEFGLPFETKDEHVLLEFDGINYRANVWVNGKIVAASDVVIGMFRRFEFEITSHCIPGFRNCVAVEIIGPGQMEKKEFRTKQIEATTGWDDHNPQPPDMNMGIWEDVRIRTTGPVRVRHPYVSSKLDVPSLETAQLTVSAEVSNLTDRAVETVLSGTIEERVFSQKVVLQPRERKTVQFSPERFPQLKLDKPRVWWPNPVGPQEIYDLSLTALVEGTQSDQTATRFGIRDATTYINEEGWRGYRLNGKNILIRGGAWMTSDMLLRFSKKRYDALIRYAKEANLNMLRSEGFSIRETDEFFDLCDEYGVMVTQQLFGRSIPDEPLAIACVEDTLLRIRNHPSLVHFLGHDETFPTPTLDQAYRDLIDKYTPERTYQPHSGAFEVEDRFETGGTRTGTRELWTYATPLQYYIGKEDGAWGFAQSGGIGGIVSPHESMRRMMPEEDLWPPWTEAWSLHTVIQGGDYFDLMLKNLEKRYGKPSGIQDFCMKAQAMNYESARAMFEAYGRNKYKATGITTWKYDAAWPASPTWQYIDWFLFAGGAYYGAKKACEPLHVQYSYDDGSVYVVNGHYRDFKGLTVTAKVFDFAMSEKATFTSVVDVGEDEKTRAFDIEAPEDLSTSYFLVLSLDDSDGKRVSDNSYWLSTVPDVPGEQGYDEGLFYTSPKSVADHTSLGNLPTVELNSEYKIEARGQERVAHVTVENPSKALAFFVHLAVTKGQGGEEVAPTFWEDNYFSLLPGEKRTVSGTVAVSDLGGQTPAVKISGWNVATSN